MMMVRWNGWSYGGGMVWWCRSGVVVCAGGGSSRCAGVLVWRSGRCADGGLAGVLVWWSGRCGRCAGGGLVGMAGVLVWWCGGLAGVLVVVWKILDAPSLHDDFYLNLVDWSSQNVLAVALGTCVYRWSATSSKATKLCDLESDDDVCSVQWTKEGLFLSIGTSLGQVQIWDATQCKRVRTMSGHQTRTSVLAWSSRILSSGSRYRNILQHDLRVSSDYISKPVGHKSEVCGLKWSHDDRELTSRGNDNQAHVRDTKVWSMGRTHIR